MPVYFTRSKDAESLRPREEYQLKIGMLSVHKDVDCLRANGEELELIRSRFTNVPMHSGELVVWRGDMAQFVYDGLCDKSMGKSAVEKLPLMGHVVRIRNGMASLGGSHYEYEYDNLSEKECRDIVDYLNADWMHNGICSSADFYYRKYGTSVSVIEVTMW